MVTLAVSLERLTEIERMLGERIDARLADDHSSIVVELTRDQDNALRIHDRFYGVYIPDRELTEDDRS